MAALAICAVTAALLRDRTDTQAPPPLRPDQPPPARTGHDLADRPRDQAPARRRAPAPAPARPCRPLAELATPPPSPLTLASSSPVPCRATAGDRTGSAQVCSRTEKRTSKRSCPDQPQCVNDHRGRIRTRSRQRRPRRGDPHRMRRPRWRPRERAPHGSGRRRPRRPQWPGRLPNRAAGAPQRQVPRHGGNALVRSFMLHVSRRPSSGSDTTTLPCELPHGACRHGDRARTGSADSSGSPIRALT